MKRLPFLPLPLAKAKQLSRHFLGWGESFSKFFPSLDFELEQSGVPLDAREWLGIAFLGGLLYTVLLGGTLLAVALAARLPLQLLIGLPVLGGLLVGGVIFLYVAFFPKLTARKKILDIERNLPYALRHILIQIRSGVTLFNTFVSIGWSNYGALSEAFRGAVNEINTGRSEVAALEKLARENPSLFFRRILWQLVNAMKSGSDIGEVLKNIVQNLSSEQLVAIKKYGSQLNPLALFYMMLVVIFPTLGIVFLLILFSFIGSAINLSSILLGILGFLFFVQVMFIGLIKSKRPLVI